MSNGRIDRLYQPFAMANHLGQTQLGMMDPIVPEMQSIITERRKIALLLSIIASTIYWYVLVLMTRSDSTCDNWSCTIENRDKISLLIALSIATMIWLQRCYTIRIHA